MSGSKPAPAHYKPVNKMEYLHDPILNKGTCFTEAERDKLGLRGLLPPRINTPDEQAQRAYNNFCSKSSDIEKFIFMAGLQERNETLYFRLVMDHIIEMMPIIYTPTVGQACQEYGQIFRHPRGLFITATDKGKFADILRNWPHKDVRVIVVTDGERILGLGDLGADGMGIPVGKLNLYTACSGVHPEFCLPITLDFGTNNGALLSDPLYIGVQKERIRGQEYDDLIEEFVQAVQEVYPNCLLQWEDFANINAFRLLQNYRDRICTFDDDIQGTGSVALSGLYSAMRMTGGKLTNQKILFLGAGEAGIGIADIICSAMVDEGLTREEARARCWFVDSKGLVVKGRSGKLAEHKVNYAHEHPEVPDLKSAVEDLQPTALFGCSGMPQTFTREIVEMMGRFNERPIVFALSNPTSKAECTAEQAYRWTGGRAIFASGSPFDPVEIEGKKLCPGQGNNAYIFPGVGLGVIATEASRVTDEMFFAAAKELAQLVSEDDLKHGCCYPPLTSIREVSVNIAMAVAEMAYDRGLARAPRPDDLKAHILSMMYQPEYKDII